MEDERWPRQVIVDGVAFDIDWAARTIDNIVYVSLTGESRNDHLQFRLDDEHMTASFIGKRIRMEMGV